MLAAFLGGWEMLLIFAVVLVLFGAKKLPELAKGLGHGIKEFKKATREVTDEIQNASSDSAPQSKYTPTVQIQPPATIPQTTVAPPASTQPKV